LYSSLADESNNEKKDAESEFKEIVNEKQEYGIKQDQSNGSIPQKENTKFEFTRSLETDPLSSQGGKKIFHVSKVFFIFGYFNFKFLYR